MLFRSATVKESITKDAKKQVGVEFLRFCGKWDLQELAKRPDDHVTYLNSRYNGNVR